MVKINMLSRNFAHDKGSTANKPPVHIEWEFNSHNNPISVYLDNDLHKGIQEKDNGKLKFLWLIESMKFDGGATSSILENPQPVIDTYEQIWTHNEQLLAIHPKFKWAPAYGSYITDFGIHPKTKLVSMIVSDKRWTKQHEIRHDFSKVNADKMDVFGRGTKEILKKEEGLKDYMFSFAAENDTYDTYFTEKILDCFATGTIPIYMGTSKIVDYFNSDGILFFDGSFDFSQLTPELYNSKMDAIKDNFERVKKYSILDDWLFENYLVHYV